MLSRFSDNVAKSFLIEIGGSTGKINKLLSNKFFSLTTTSILATCAPKGITNDSIITGSLGAFIRSTNSELLFHVTQSNSSMREKERSDSSTRIDSDNWALSCIEIRINITIKK